MYHGYKNYDGSAAIQDPIKPVIHKKSLSILLFLEKLVIKNDKAIISNFFKFLFIPLYL